MQVLQDFFTFILVVVWALLMDGGGAARPSPVV